jgi:type I restriction enzyme S subunit
MKAGWEIKKLGEVCEFDKNQGIYSGLPYVGLEDIQSDTAQFVGSETARSVKSSTFRFSQRHVLYGRLRPYLNKALTPDFEGHCSTEIFPLSPLGNLDRKYLLMWLMSDETKGKINATCTGARMPRADMNEVLDFPIPIPPLSEQAHIVGILDEAFASIATAKANTQKNLENAKAVFESHLNSVFSKRGEGWVEKKLGEIGRVSMCKRIFKEETVPTEGIPFYKIGTFGKEPDAFIPTEIYNSYRKKYPFPKKGDVLISASGTIGRRVRYDGEPAYFQDSNIVWIDNDEKQVLNEYLYHFYGACEWNSTKGATIARLYNDDLRQV